MARPWAQLFYHRIDTIDAILKALTTYHTIFMRFILGTSEWRQWNNETVCTNSAIWAKHPRARLLKHKSSESSTPKVRIQSSASPVRMACPRPFISRWRTIVKMPLSRTLRDTGEVSFLTCSGYLVFQFVADIEMIGYRTLPATSDHRTGCHTRSIASSIRIAPAAC